MKEKFSKYKSVVIFVSGAMNGKNPGVAATAACFYGRKIEIQSDLMKEN